LLLQIHVANRAALNDPLNSHHVQPLQPFYQNLIDELQLPDSDLTKYPTFLGQQLELLLFAIQQRVEGSHNLIRRSGGSFMTYQGGWQRVLEAYDQVTLQMLSAAGQRWSGFVVIGFSPDFRRFHGGVLNVPRDAINPHQAWGLFHEIGHEWGDLVDITREPAIAEVLKTLQVPDLAELTWEIGAEAFAWLHGFGFSSWELCRELTWRYLSRMHQVTTAPSPYIVRWLALLLLRQSLMGSRYADLEDFERDARAFRRDIERRVTISEDQFAVCLSLAWALRAILPALRALLGASDAEPERCSAATNLTRLLTEDTRLETAIAFFLETWHST
jgi:hypothetical protein